MSTPYIKMEGIAKSFGPVQALQSVDLEIYPNEIHALLGENGAGKSTLMKILSGIYEPTAGKIIINNVEYAKLDHKVAARLGIGIIYQELSVIDELTVLENLFIGRLPVKKVFGVNVVDWHDMRTKAAIMLLRVGLKIRLDEKVGNLSISQKQMLEIAKTLMLDARVIIMDEPTSSLTYNEVDYLFLIMNQLRQDGTAIVYISHKLNEIRRICNRYTVLKDGSSVASGQMGQVTNDDIVRLMVGRELQNRFRSLKEKVGGDTGDADIIFAVENITSRDKRRVKHVSFQVKKGEIMGFAGLVGSGRTEFMNCIFGVEPKSSGKVMLHNVDITPSSPLDALKKGMGYITESRRENGFFDNFSIAQNIAISKSLKDGGYKGALGLFNPDKERQLAETQRRLLSLKCSSVDQNITELSGGNQQKVLISKWLCCEPEVIIFDEPTRGIDVGAKAEIYKVMRTLAATGKTILMVSSELPEIITVCDRIAIFCEGTLAHILDNNESIGEEDIMTWALPQS
ncbi:D-allose ABC transporter ATP-binding protein AlsA [Sodalis sp. RH23]|uniref:D-allose ABC transporter ATP-binding protein AlsA n=1 Tax=unclassified Sodalis (in: enterobacteria) TaxID=2636512 RepID=UPI0039B5CDE8